MLKIGLLDSPTVPNTALAPSRAAWEAKNRHQISLQANHIKRNKLFFL